MLVSLVILMAVAVVYGLPGHSWELFKSLCTVAGQWIKKMLVLVISMFQQLSNLALRDEYNEALNEAIRLRRPWAMDMKRVLLSNEWQNEGTIANLQTENAALEERIKEQAVQHSAIDEGRKLNHQRLEEERERLVSENKRLQSTTRGLEREVADLTIANDRLRSNRVEPVAALGALSAIPQEARDTLAAIPDLKQVLEDCVVCHDCLLKDIASVSFGVMSYSCGCTGPTPRKMHVNCIVSMSDLSCPLCQSPITIIAPSLMTATRVQRFDVAKTRDSRGETIDASRGRIGARRNEEMSPDEALFAERVAAATARLRMQIARTTAMNRREPYSASHLGQPSGASNHVEPSAARRGEPSMASTDGEPAAVSHRGETAMDLAARARAQIEAFIRGDL